jgi:uncharacterized protein (TIGR04141 family)
LADSVSASHLFNQAQVSALALCNQPDAVTRLRDKIHEFSSGRRTLPQDFRPATVVLAFAGKAATVEALFTFSQVALHRCAQTLDLLNVDLRIFAIESSDEIAEEMAGDSGRPTSRISLGDNPTAGTSR